MQNIYHAAFKDNLCDILYQHSLVTSNLTGVTSVVMVTTRVTMTPYTESHSEFLSPLWEGYRDQGQRGVDAITPEP